MKPESAEPTAVYKELESLVRTGGAQAEFEACDGLANLILQSLGGLTAYPLTVQGDLVKAVLIRVVRECRQQAYEKRNIRYRLAADMDCFQVSAAGELLEITDDVTFDRFKEIRCPAAD